MSPGAAHCALARLGESVVPGAKLKNRLVAGGVARDVRSWEKTSDHAPARTELKEIAQSGFRKKDRELPAARTPGGRPLRAESGRARIGVQRENILQLLPDAVPPAREELAAYWAKVWKSALPHLGRRLLKLVRHVRGTTFYHKGPLPSLPEAVHTITVEKREGGEGTRLWVDDLAGFLGLVEIGAVELHPWNASIDDIEHPDLLVFDLDPGEGVAWEFVIETVLKLRRMLRDDGLEPWPKLTGGKGLHLMAPLEPKINHDQARACTKRIAQRLAASAPDRYTLSADPGRRAGRIFIHYLRNGRGTTAISAWSPRARAGFPIAVPVSWRQVENGIRHRPDSPVSGPAFV
jgi:bifunctional non-homologous end joining protein LigD